MRADNRNRKEKPAVLGLLPWAYWMIMESLSWILDVKGVGDPEDFGNWLVGSISVELSNSLEIITRIEIHKLPARQRFVARSGKS